jgi:hypothetical protein
MVKKPFWRFSVYGTKFQIGKINMENRSPDEWLSKNATNAKKRFKIESNRAWKAWKDFFCFFCRGVYNTTSLKK